MTENSPDALQQQPMSELEKQFEAFRVELERRRTQDKGSREVIHQMVGEKMETEAQEQPFEAVSHEDVLADPNGDIEESLKELLQVAATQGPNEGIRLAVKSRNPELIDRFHDALTDNIDTLISTGTITEVK
ncbi:MAG: hypothetical protein KW806_00630 [Candidatus Yanofskybacteria bacterium]|nr:hypothetical protein [Candidatus Yanofskybacteria bacterium]